VSVVVIDEGIGVDVGEMPRLFERFYRGTLARRHEPEGSGLGLAIARMIADRYRWALHVGPAMVDGAARGCRAEVRLAVFSGIAPAVTLDTAVIRQPTDVPVRPICQLPREGSPL